MREGEQIVNQAQPRDFELKGRGAEDQKQEQGGNIGFSFWIKKQDCSGNKGVNPEIMSKKKCERDCKPDITPPCVIRNRDKLSGGPSRECEDYHRKE